MNHKVVFNVFKASIALLTLGYVAYQMLFVADPLSFFKHFQVFDPIFGFLLFLVLVGVVANWGSEVLKWKFLYSRIYGISKVQALKGVLSGCAISIWMPNRTGDYLGRIMFLPGRYYGKAVVASVFGNLVQLFVTVLAGFLALMFLGLVFLPNDSALILGLVSGPFLIVLLGVCFYPVLFVKLAPYKVKNFPIRKYLLVLVKYDIRDRLKIIGFSMLRYGFFLLQYVLLLWAFQVEITFMQAIAGVSLVFLVQSVIPSFALMEAGVRGAASLYFIGLFAGNETGILMASYGLWMFNLVVPALAGTYFITKEGIVASKEIYSPINSLFSNFQVRS